MTCLKGRQQLNVGGVTEQILSPQHRGDHSAWWHPRAFSNGLPTTNFSPLFLLLSSFWTSQQVKITDVTQAL